MNTWNTNIRCQCESVVLHYCVCVLTKYLYVLPVLLLCLIFSLLVLQSVFFGFNEVLIVATVTVQPLGVQVNDVCHNGVEEVSVVGDDQDGGLPRLGGLA